MRLVLFLRGSYATHAQRSSVSTKCGLISCYLHYRNSILCAVMLATAWREQNIRLNNLPERPGGIYIDGHILNIGYIAPPALSCLLMPAATGPSPYRRGTSAATATWSRPVFASSSAQLSNLTELTSCGLDRNSQQMDGLASATSGIVHVPACILWGEVLLSQSSDA